MAVKINKLEIENVKRVNAVTMEPAENGLTIIGGDNAQGKTSVLDSIAWALGGNKYKPSVPKREGSESDPYLSITMNNGLKVERKGKNSSLVVTDPSGMKGGQQLLDKFVEELALDLPKFMQESSSEKAKTLLNIIGVGPKLAELDAKEKKAFDDRTFTKRTLDQAESYAKGLEFFPDAPEENQSVAELVERRDEILKHNESNSKKRDFIIAMENSKKSAEEAIHKLEAQISELKKREEELYKSLDDIIVKLDRSKKESLLLKDLSTDEIDSQIKNIDEVNYKVTANRNKRAAEAEAKKYKEQHESLTKEIESIRKQKQNLLNGANLPLPELSVVDGELTYKGQMWDNMSGSERLKVSTSIIRKLNPDCGFVLIDGIEGMDIKTLNEFGEWLNKEGLQAIATRVSKGEECQIIIEDGYSVQKDKQVESHD